MKCMNNYIWSEYKSCHVGVLFKFRRVGQLAPGVASSYSLRPVVGWVVSSLTVGFIKNETLIFLNFSAQGASILKISVPIIKRRS